MEMCCPLHRTTPALQSVLFLSFRPLLWLAVATPPPCTLIDVLDRPISRVVGLPCLALPVHLSVSSPPPIRSLSLSLPLSLSLSLSSSSSSSTLLLPFLFIPRGVLI
jgi:hypothetical protein